MGLDWPGEFPGAEPTGRDGQHSEALPELLDTLSEVYRIDPAAKW